MRSTWRLSLQTAAAVMWIAVLVPRAQQAVPGAADSSCAWRPPLTRTTVEVGSVDALVAAVREARPSTTILLKDGEYRLSSMLDIAVPDVVLRAKSGDRSKVLIHGEGMNERRVGVALSISAPRVTVADLSIGDVGYHGVQVRGEKLASHVVLYNIHVFDTGQQLVKGSLAAAQAADDGLVACSLFEYTDHAPSDYTNGVDVLGGKGWIVRDNRFVRIRGPQDRRWSAGPAVLFWANSIDTVVERNVIIDSFRGIALGLMAGANALSRLGDGRFDHQGGVVRNNVLCNLNPWADEGIEVNSARDVQVDHNTVLVEGGPRWSISVRFPASSGWVRNNLTSRPIIFRDGAKAGLGGNVTGSGREWFVAPQRCDLRLTPSATPALRAGVPLATVPDDFIRKPRGTAGAPDAGAFEYAVIK